MGSQWVSLLVAILICQFAGLVGATFTRPAIPTWYTHLAKPRWTPPDWAFAIVWPTLYLLMAFALWLVWLQHDTHPQAGTALGLFGVQLALNVIWSGLFFGIRAIAGALFELILLALAIFATTLLFYRIDPFAGLLMLPYLLWTAYALALNAAIWKHNRPQGALGDISV